MKEAENFMNKNYRVALQYDPDGYWIAEHPELPGCKADGETAQEALSSLDISRELWIESRLATSLEVPEPQEAPQYSGRFVLRIPKSLHRDLANEAEEEGVSLNSLVSNVLAGRHARNEQIVNVQQAVALNSWPSLQMQPMQKQQRGTTFDNVIPISGQQSQQSPFIGNSDRRAINA
jgi:predicted RNase H-like HicB family nuclease